MMFCGGSCGVNKRPMYQMPSCQPEHWCTTWKLDLGWVSCSQWLVNNQYLSHTVGERMPEKFDTGLLLSLGPKNKRPPVSWGICCNPHPVFNLKDFIANVKALREINPPSFCGLDVYMVFLSRFVKASSGAYLGAQDDVAMVDIHLVSRHSFNDAEARRRCIRQDWTNCILQVWGTATLG